MRRTIALLGISVVVAIDVAGAQRRTPTRADSVQRRDSIRRDSTGLLAPVEVRASIVPTASPTIGSGVPARMSTISVRTIDAWRPRILPDLLAAQPGVSFYDDLGTPWKLNLSMRGFNTGPTLGLPPGISVFLDGVRQNEPDAQEVNFDLLPIDHVKQIEILNGSASLLGPNSLGGAINLISDRGTGPAAGELETSVGSFGALAAQGTVRGGAGNGWDYYLSGGGGRERGWRQATGDANRSVFANIGHSGERRGLRIQAFGSSSRAETAGSLPASIFAVSPQLNFTPGDFEDLDAQQISASAYAPVGPGQGALTAYFRRSAAERFNVNQSPDPNIRGLTKNYTIGGSADWRKAVALGGGTIAWRVGVDAAANRVRVRIFEESPGEATVDNATGRENDEARVDGLTTDIRSPSWDIAGYALVDYHLNRLTISAGARDDHVRVPFRDRLDPAGDAANSYHHVSPRGGATVVLGHGASAYASAGTSFRAPAILELGCADPEAACPLPFALGDDPPLKPVLATTYEAGGRWVGAGGAVVVNGSLYRTEVRNEIFFVASERALLSGYFTNLDRTRRQGGELAIEGRSVGERVEWYVNYAITHATFRTTAQLFSIRSDDDFATSPLAGPNSVAVGSRLPLVPDRQAKAGGLVRLGSGMSAGVDTRFIGRQWLRGDEANETRPLPGYSLTSLRLSLTIGPWEVAGVVTNVFASQRANFGTYNENRQTAQLERFLTPLNARGLKIILRRSIARRNGDSLGSTLPGKGTSPLGSLEEVSRKPGAIAEAGARAPTS